MEYIIEFRKVVKSYDTKSVLSGMSFGIQKGEFVGLIGNNACGKTTSLNILCNLITYDSGEVLVFNRKVVENYVEYKAKFGIVLSKPYYIEDFTPEEYLYFVSKFQKIASNNVAGRIKDILEFVDLAIQSGNLIRNLSSGDQMKVSIAGALIHNPEVLILDEPFINLDIATIENLLGKLNRLRGSKTLFITSHNLDLISNLCDKFLVINEGIISSTFQKSDFSSLDELKESIKSGLVRREKSADLSWLK